MFNSYVKSFLICLFLCTLSPAFAMDTFYTTLYKTIAIAFIPFSHTYNKLNGYHYTKRSFRTAFKNSQQNNYAEKSTKEVKKYIKNGVEINYRIGKNKETFLIGALRNSNLNLANYLRV